MKAATVSVWIVLGTAAMGCSRSPTPPPSTNASTAVADRPNDVRDAHYLAASGDTAEAAPANKRPKAQILLNVVAKLGDAEGPGPGGEAEFKVKQRDGVVKKLFDLELARAKPGEVYKVEIDGVAVGEITIEEDGEGELEFSSEADEVFPTDFPDLKVGSTVKVGDRFEAKFEPKPASEAPQAN
jgi:hypothetical protein